MIYLVISNSKISELEYAVNSRIKEWYAPNSGIAIGSNGVFHQSMIHTQKFIEVFADLEKKRTT